MAPVMNLDSHLVLEQARKCAEELEQVFITPEHLLLAMLESDCKARAFLKEHFAASKIASELRQYLRSFKSPKSRVMRDLNASLGLESLRAQRVRHQGEEFADRFKSRVSSLHLLWALLQEDQCLAVRSLVRHRLDRVEDSNEAEDISKDVANRLRQDWCIAIEKQLISSGTGLPELMAASSNRRASDASLWRERLSEVGSQLLQDRVIQSSAVARVANALTRSWANVLGNDRPLATFLFVGPRGSGKRSLARNLASFLYGNAARLFSVSLGDFGEDVHLSQLLANAPEKNAPDNSQDSQLTKIASEYPFSVIYLEDIERANSKTMDMIHQLLKHGHTLDSNGKVVNFRGNVVILSLGIDPMYFEREQPVGLRSNIPNSGSTQESYERMLMPDLERLLRADTIGLADEVVFFPPLTDAELIERAKILAKELSDNVQRRYKITLDIEQSVYEYLMKRLRDLGKDTGNLRRIFTREVSNAVAQGLLNNTIKIGRKARLFVPENEGKVDEGQAITIEAV